MASGALVFVDHMYVPRPSPFIHGAHLVFYDNNNRTSLTELLDYYRSHKELSRRVAVTGYIHAMRYHRAANLIDYVFRTLHLSELMTHDGHMDELIKLSTPSSSSSSSKVDHHQHQHHQYLLHLNQQLYGYHETGYHLRYLAMEDQRVYKLKRTSK